jgi:hypothetical protein
VAASFKVHMQTLLHQALSMQLLILLLHRDRHRQQLPLVLPPHQRHSQHSLLTQQLGSQLQQRQSQQRLPMQL